jgi:hypothetical protein
MYKGQALDLDHDDHDRSRYRAQPLSHASCNRAAGAAFGNKRRRRRGSIPEAPTWQSRVW